MPNVVIQLLMEERGVSSTLQGIQKEFLTLGDASKISTTGLVRNFFEIQDSALGYLKALEQLHLKSNVPLVLKENITSTIAGITPTVQGITNAVTLMKDGNNLAFPLLISQLQNVNVSARPVEAALGSLAGKARAAEATYRSLTEQIRAYSEAQIAVTKKINEGGLDADQIKSLQAKRKKFGRQEAEARGKQDVVGQYDIGGTNLNLLDDSGKMKQESVILGEMVLQLREIKDGAVRTAEALRMGGPALAQMVNESGNLYESLNKNRLTAQELTHIQSRGDNFLTDLDKSRLKFEEGLSSLESKINATRAELSSLGSSKGKDTLLLQLESLENKITQTGLTYGNLVRKLETEPTTLEGLVKAENQLKTAEVQFDVASKSMSISLERVQNSTNALGSAIEKTAKGPLQHFQSVFMGTFMGQIAYSAINQVFTVISDIGQHLIDDPTKMEAYNTQFSRLYGSAVKGRQEVNKILGESLTTGVPVEKLLEVDRSLATFFGTNPAKYAGQFHRSMEQIKQDVIDAASSREGLQASDAMNILARAQQGAFGRVLDSLREMRLGSEEELRRYGVNITKSGQVTSTNVELINGILGIWEHKFGGLGKAQSITFEGMKIEASNFMTYLGATLGQDVMREIKVHLLDFFETMKKPEVQQTLQEWGFYFGKATKLAFDLFDVIGKGVGFIIGVFKPLTDIIGDFLRVYPDDPIKMREPWDVAADAAKSAADQFQKTTAQVVDYKSQIKDLEEVLGNMRRGAELQGIAFDKMLAPIKEAEQAADRLFSHFQKTNEVNKLKQEIARDHALARDTYSSEGRSAALRLVDEQARLTSLIQEQAHTSQKEGFQDQISAIEKKKTAFTQDTKITEIGIESQIAALQKLQRAIDDAAVSTSSLNDNFDNLDPGNLPAVSEEVGTFRDRLGDSATNAWSLANIWENQLKPALTDIVSVFTGDQGLNNVALGFQTIMIQLGLVGGNIWDTFELTIIGVARTLGNLGNLLGAVVQDGARDLSNFIVMTANAGKVAANLPVQFSNTVGGLTGIPPAPLPFPGTELDTGVDKTPSRIPKILSDFGTINTDAAKEGTNRSQKRSADQAEAMAKLFPGYDKMNAAEKLEVLNKMRSMSGLEPEKFIGPPTPGKFIGPPNPASTLNTPDRSLGNSTVNKSKTTTPYSASKPPPAVGSYSGSGLIAEIRLNPSTITIESVCASCGTKENKQFIKMNINYISELLANRAR